MSSGNDQYADDELAPFDFTPDQFGQLSPECMTRGGDPFTFDEDAVRQAVNEDAMTADFVIVTRSNEVNRHGNKVQIVANENGQGMLTDVFERSGSVLFEHGFDPDIGGMPVATSIDQAGHLVLKKSRKKSTARAHFHNGIEKSEIIFAAVAARMLNMASIALLPRRAMMVSTKPPKLEEGVEDISNESFRGFDFVESELLEWSIVVSGVDRGSFRQAAERGSVGGVKLSSRMRPVFQRIGGSAEVWSPGVDMVDGLIVAPESPKKLGVNWQASDGRVLITGATEQLAQDAYDRLIWFGEKIPIASELPTDHRLEQAQTTTPPAESVDSEPQADTVPTITAQEVAQEFDRRDQLRQIKSVLETVASKVGATIEKALEPIKEDQAKARRDLETLIGKLPS